MAYDERLAERIRRSLSGEKEIAEKRMFGGVAFLLRGKMLCGIVKQDLVVRVGADRYNEAFLRPHVRPMDFTGRPLKGFVFVASGGIRTDRQLRQWIGEATSFVKSHGVKDHPARRRTTGRRAPHRGGRHGGG